MVAFDKISASDPRHGIDMARELTASLMPAGGNQSISGRGPDPEVAWRSLTADEVGGDFYDLLPGPHGEVYLVIGDVSGSGPLAALFMAMTTCLLRILAQDGFHPGHMLRVANRILQPHLGRRGLLITAQVACYRPDSRMLALASAGHLWPHIMKSDGFEEVPLTGVPLGVQPESEYAEVVDSVNPGQRMVLYTDGLVECTDSAGEMFGFERLGAALAGAKAASAEDLVGSLFASFSGHVKEGRRRDDVSVVAVAWS